jgi:hypothetical protein
MMLCGVGVVRCVGFVDTPPLFWMAMASEECALPVPSDDTRRTELDILEKRFKREDLRLAPGALNPELRREEDPPPPSVLVEAGDEEPEAPPAPATTAATHTQHTHM